MYRRRRIVVAVAALLVLSLTIWCAYSVVRGIAAVAALAGGEGKVSLVRNQVPQPRQGELIADCNGKTTSLQLTAAAQSMPVGGSMDFTATIVHEGNGSCLIDAADDERVLTITSGNDVVWSSDVCPVDSRMLLMAKGDKDSQTMTWAGVRTGDSCQDVATLPKVDRGTYVAQLHLREYPKVTSQPVTVVVE